MKFFDIDNAIRAGSKVALLIRHAERPPLDPGDTSFGATLPITDRGRKTAEYLGMRLSHLVTPDRIRAYASSTLRTVQTAESILKGVQEEGYAGPLGKVSIEPVLGSDSPFFGSLDERMALIAEGRYRERLNDYFETGVQRGYTPLAAATDRMEGRLGALMPRAGGLTVAVTHDVNVACFLAGRDVVTSFTEETWPFYLDAAVMIESTDGSRRYGVWRWDRTFDGIDL